MVVGTYHSRSFSPNLEFFPSGRGPGVTAPTQSPSTMPVSPKKVTVVSPGRAARTVPKSAAVAREKRRTRRREEA